MSATIQDPAVALFSTAARHQPTLSALGFATSPGVATQFSLHRASREQPDAGPEACAAASAALRAWRRALETAGGIVVMSAEGRLDRAAQRPGGLLVMALGPRVLPALITSLPAKQWASEPFATSITWDRTDGTRVMGDPDAEAVDPSQLHRVVERWNDETLSPMPFLRSLGYRIAVPKPTAHEYAAAVRQSMGGPS